MSDEFVTKTQAIMEISMATGYGRYAIERKLDELSDQGKITIYDDPGDSRKKQLSRIDLLVVIDSLKIKR